MKIYTRTGDEGDTSLFRGGRVPKDHLRVAAYGDVDELCSWLGLAAAGLQNLEAEIREIQGDLFTIGADLATPAATAGDSDRTVRIADERVAAIEALIDRYDAETEPLTSFILPGGDPGAAELQVARTVCRRAERAVVALAAGDEVNPTVLRYLNRLSDLLFVLARWVNRRAGVEEPKWGGG